jgi:hypothetical protein
MVPDPETDRLALTRRHCSRGRGKIPNVPSVDRLLLESQMKTRRPPTSYSPLGISGLTPLQARCSSPIN